MSAAGKPKKPDIYSRLTDPKNYTGAHKERFDADGKGKGKAGRTDAQINDISQIVRGGGVSGGYRPRSESNPSSKKPVVTSKPTVLADRPAASPKKAASPTGAQKKDIVSRLTDTKNYTGAHKQRFDADGHGKGKAGRSDTQINDISQIVRGGGLSGTAAPAKASTPKRNTVSGVSPMHVTKFGTQAAVARKIHIFQNGDKHHKGVVITMVKGITTMDKLLGAMTNALTLTTGAAQRVYRVGGAAESFTQVTSLDSFEDGGIYLACGPEKIDKVKVPSALTGAPPS